MHWYTHWDTHWYTHSHRYGLKPETIQVTVREQAVVAKPRKRAAAAPQPPPKSARLQAAQARQETADSLVELQAEPQARTAAADAEGFPDGEAFNEAWHGIYGYPSELRSEEEVTELLRKEPAFVARVVASTIEFFGPSPVLCRKVALQLAAQAAQPQAAEVAPVEAAPVEAAPEEVSAEDAAIATLAEAAADQLAADQFAAEAEMTDAADQHAKLQQKAEAERAPEEKAEAADSRLVVD